MLKDEKLNTVVDWLSRAKYASAELDALNRRLNKIVVPNFGGTIAIDYTKTYVSGRKSQTTENDYNKVMEIVDAIAQKINDVSGVYAEVSKLIYSIDNGLYRTLLSKRYLDGADWYDIAATLRYSVTYTSNELHVKALTGAYDRLKSYKIL